MTDKRALTLAVSLLTASWCTASTANDMEEIYVSAQSIEETIPLDLMQYGSRVEIISAEDLQRMGYTEVSQALQMLVPGLHMRAKNGPFDYFDASLQGSRTKDILWLVDGVRITNRLYNGTSPLDTIPTHMVERIEILKGGQGIFYGTQSVGGVINIVTLGFTEGSDGAFGAGANDNSGFNAHAYYRGTFGDHQVVAYASKDQADGYQPYRDEDIQASATDMDRSYDVNVFGLKYAWNATEDSRLSIAYQRTENELDFLRAFLNANTVNEREEDILVNATPKARLFAADPVNHISHPVV